MSNIYVSYFFVLGDTLLLGVGTGIHSSVADLGSAVVHNVRVCVSLLQQIDTVWYGEHPILHLMHVQI